MTNLLTLNSIPAAGRNTEREARKAGEQHGSYMMIRTNGTFMGRVLTEAAASAIMAASMVTLPNGKRSATVAVRFAF